MVVNDLICLMNRKSNNLKMNIMCSMRCLIVLSIFQYGIAKESLPLFLIDHDLALGHFSTLEPNPFTSTGSDLFSSILNDAVNQSSVFIIFIEDKFCTEDISKKDENGSPFPNLHEDLLKYKVKYMPSVFKPINYITRILEPTQSNVFVLKPGQKFQPTQGLNSFYVFFKDNIRDESRTATLRRHDTAIHEIYGTTRKMTTGPVVALYTGKVNPSVLTDYDRYVHPSSGSKDPGGNRALNLASGGALFRFHGIKMNIIKDGYSPRSTDLFDMPLVVAELRSESQQTERLETSIEFQGVQMKFFFRFSDEYWFLDNVMLIHHGQTIGTTRVDIKVPIGNSYFCDEPLVLFNQNDMSSITIPQFQIQAFRQYNPGPDFRQRRKTTTTPMPPATKLLNMLPQLVNKSLDSIFILLYKNNLNLSNPYELLVLAEKTRNDTLIKIIQNALAGSAGFSCLVLKCNTYFSAPILSALFVLAIWIGTVCVAVVFLSRLQTNDRYEHPHAKAVIISMEG